MKHVELQNKYIQKVHLVDLFIEMDTECVSCEVATPFFKVLFQIISRFRNFNASVEFSVCGISHGIRVLNDNKTEFGERKKNVAWMDMCQSAAVDTAWCIL